MFTPESTSVSGNRARIMSPAAAGRLLSFLDWNTKGDVDGSDGSANCGCPPHCFCLNESLGFFAVFYLKTCRKTFGTAVGDPEVALSMGFMSGAEGRNRTGDTRIFSPLLYRLSYLGK